MRILGQPGRDVVDERIKRIRVRTGTHAGFPSPTKYLQTVLRSKPVWRAIAEIVQPCLRSACTSTSSSHVSMRKRASFGGATGVRHQQPGRRPAFLGGATRMGNLDERQWGISVSAVKDPGVINAWLFNPQLR